MPLSISGTDWNELLGTHPSYISITPTDSSNSDVSTADTILLMQRYADEDSHSKQVQEAVDEIRDKAIDDSEMSLIESTFEWVKDHVQFQSDESVLNRLFGVKEGTELLIKPSRLLSMNTPMGDCDDFSMLTRSLLTNMGIKADYMTVAADSQQIGRWSHVYTQATLKDGKTVPVDSSHGKYVGWEAPFISRKGLWGTSGQTQTKKGEVNSMDLSALKGLGQYDYGGETVTGADLPSGDGVDWGSIFGPLSSAGSSILKAQFGQPQLAPNTYIRTPQGGILTNQPVTTAGILPAGAGSVGSSLSSILPIILIGGLGLLIFGAMGKR
jgi:hypothetical protein